MTLLEIQILIHYRCFATDFRNGDFSAPAVGDAITVFRDDLDLLEITSGEEVPVYKITERGTVFVDALKELPLPKQVWVTE